MAEARPLRLVSGADIAALLADESRLVLVAQPIVDLRRAVVVGYETLARFTLETPTSPDRVFAEATRCGLGPELEAVVVRRALSLSERVPANCFLTINVDPAHLAADAIWQALEARRDLSGIVFELTEHREIEKLSDVVRAAARLRHRGAVIAMDDAGSGYSGLKQILELRPQLLKIDRELITNVHEDEAKRSLIEMLGNLAGRLDAWVLAEGIETEAELHALQKLGVPLGQGYYLGRPAPPWSGLANAAVETLAAAGRVELDVTSVARLVEPVARCAPGGSWPSGARIAVGISDDGRPLSLRLLDSRGEITRASHELLKIKPQSRITDIAYRAATRPEAFRWDPVVCIDEQGKLAGVIEVQRLLCALADLQASARP